MVAIFGRSRVLPGAFRSYLGTKLARWVAARVGVTVGMSYIIGALTDLNFEYPPGDVLVHYFAQTVESSQFYFYGNGIGRKT